MASKYPHVFEPFEIRGVLFKNHLEQAPPGCFFAGDERGFVTDQFVEYFRQYARGGVAVCNVGNCSIDITESSDEAGQLQLSDPGCVMPARKFSEMCEIYGAHGSFELTHNGKDTAYENVGHAPYSASSFITVAEERRAKMLGRDPYPTIEMSKEKIRETVEKYARAARFCKQAGMKICMIHGAHGNLIAQFASPKYNKRTDEYGGSLQNRARFANEILEAVRGAVGQDFVIEYRLSADEHAPDQMHFPETLEFIKYIKDRVDILHVSAGIHDLYGEPYYLRYLVSNYTMPQKLNVHFSAAVKQAYPDLTVAVVGGIKDPGQAEEIISSGQADLVAMNRALHADYDMPRKYAEGKEWQHMPCLRCSCFRMASPHTNKLCSVNPMWGRFKDYPQGCLPPAPVKKKVAVIGGGPAGVESVKWLLQRGHDVTLYEKSGKIGGHVRDAVKADFKAFETTEPFDLIVSNPPYFTDALKAPDKQRNMARHNDTLNYHQLFQQAHRLLCNEGECCLIIPAEAANFVKLMAERNHLFPKHITHIYTKPGKPCRMVFITFWRGAEPDLYYPGDCQQDELYLMDTQSQYSPAYRSLTEDFYLKL